MSGPDRKEIAERVRELIAGQDGGDLSLTARRFGVEEVSLRMSIDEVSPFTTIDVLTAVVGLYGVDPTFLLTGHYDSTTHRRVLEGDAGAAADAIRQLAGGQTTSPTVAQPTAEPPRLHIA